MVPLRALPIVAAICLLPEKPVESRDDPFQATREAFLTRINAERFNRGLPPLRLAPPLCRVAQEHSEEFARGGSSLDSLSMRVDAQRVAKVGYDARFVSEVVAQSDGDVDSVVASSQAPPSAMEVEIRRPETRDLGIGVAVYEDVPLYVFLFGLTWEEFFSQKTAELSNTGRIRGQLLERLNRERARRSVLPLQPNALLDEAAQRHATDMLARSYYGHESPEGTTVLERTRTQGYRPRFVAENVARGQYSIEEVMDGWMASDTHREHILSKLFSEVGSGLAIGKNTNGYQVIWVQCFGRPKDLLPAPRPRFPNPGRRTDGA